MTATYDLYEVVVQTESETVTVRTWARDKDEAQNNATLEAYARRAEGNGILGVVRCRFAR